MTTTFNTPTSNLLTVVTNALPSLSGSGITYNERQNIFLSTGYTSAAGNTYYQGIRLSDRLIINYDLGDGYAYTFLNGLKLYCFDNREKKLIGSELYNCRIFSESYARREVIRLLSNYLRSQAQILGTSIDEHLLIDFSEHLADEAIAQKSRLLT